MKKYLLPLSVLTLLSLSACQPTSTSSLSSLSSNENSSLDSSSASKPSDSSTSSSDEGGEKEDPVIIEVDKTYALSTKPGEGTTIKLETELDAAGKLPAGSEVVFEVELTGENFELSMVRADGKELVPDAEGKYSFVMPRRDVAIETEAISLGEESIVATPDVTAEMIPTTASAVKDLLTKEKDLEGTYFQSGTYSHFGGSYEENFSYDIVAGRNDVLHVSGYQLSSSNAAYGAPYFVERGIDETGKYYEYVKKGTLSSSTKNATETLETEDILTSEDEEGGGVSQEQAKSLVSSYGFADIVLGEYFNEDSSEYRDFTRMDEAKITPVVAEDKKSFTVTLDGVHDTGYTLYLTTLSLTFDGTGFLTSAQATRDSYSEYDEETHAPNPGAEPSESETNSLTATRGYKKTIDRRIHLKDYAMHDYDVNVSYRLPNTYDSISAKDNVVENGSTLSFQIISRDDNALLVPEVVRAEEEGFVEISYTYSGKEVKVLKEGTFHLVFDNGLGEEKTIELTSVKPKPTSVSGTLSSHTVFVNSSVTLTVTIVPEMADQGVTAVVNAEKSTGEADIVETEEAGVFTVTGKKEGEVVIDLASTEDPSVTGSVTLNVKNPPDATALKETLTTKTMSGKESSSYEETYLYFNFNADGTGSFRIGSDYYGMTWEDVQSFTWSLDETTLDFTITCDATRYVFEAARALDNTSIEVDVSYFGSVDTYTLTATDRIEDLSTLG